MNKEIWHSGGSGMITYCAIFITTIVVSVVFLLDNKLPNNVVKLGGNSSNSNTIKEPVSVITTNNIINKKKNITKKVTWK